MNLHSHDQLSGHKGSQVIAPGPHSIVTLCAALSRPRHLEMFRLRARLICPLRPVSSGLAVVAGATLSGCEPT